MVSENIQKVSLIFSNYRLFLKKGKTLVVLITLCFSVSPLSAQDKNIPPPLPDLQPASAPSTLNNGLVECQSGDEAENNHDYETAMKFYLKSLSMGNKDAEFKIGDLYEKGYDTSYERGYCGDPCANYEEALKWFLKAADIGNSDAQDKIGTFYENGYGVTEDYQEALKWYLLAAAKKNGKAERNIGAMYHEGRGVPKDYQKAMTWFLSAANDGNADAEYFVGMAYWDGNGVIKDNKEALKWIEKAVAGGNDDAKRYVDAVRETASDPNALVNPSTVFGNLTNQYCGLLGNDPNKPHISIYNYWMGEIKYSTSVKTKIKAIFSFGNSSDRRLLEVWTALTYLYGLDKGEWKKYDGVSQDRISLTEYLKLKKNISRSLYLAFLKKINETQGTNFTDGDDMNLSGN